MANTVNVTTANTFEQWRVKTNELGTKIGDLDEVTNSDIGATTIVAAVKAHQNIVASSLASTGGTMTGNMDFNDNVKASDNFNSIMADKLKDALDAKKIDLASTMTDRASEAEES